MSESLNLALDIQRLRQKIEAGIRDLPHVTQVIITAVTDRYVARVSELAEAVADNDHAASDLAESRIRDLRDGLYDAGAIIDAHERAQSAALWAEIIAVGRDATSGAMKVAASIATQALADAALTAFAGSAR